jgi:Holliday junction resolvase
MVNSKQKGSAGERALKSKFHEELGFYLVRNLSQAAKGGYDASIRKFDDQDAPVVIPFAIEFKRDEKMTTEKMWEQAITQTTQTCFIPVVIYKRNYKPWRFIMSLDAARLIPDGKFTASFDQTIEMGESLFFHIAREWLNLEN